MDDELDAVALNRIILSGSAAVMVLGRLMFQKWLIASGYFSFSFSIHNRKST
jgi:hypothetical protein